MLHASAQAADSVPPFAPNNAVQPSNPQVLAWMAQRPQPPLCWMPTRRGCRRHAPIRLPPRMQVGVVPAATAQPTAREVHASRCNRPAGVACRLWFLPSHQCHQRCPAALPCRAVGAMGTLLQHYAAQLPSVLPAQYDLTQEAAVDQAATDLGGERSQAAVQTSCLLHGSQCACTIRVAAARWLPLHWAARSKAAGGTALPPAHAPPCPQAWPVPTRSPACSRHVSRRGNCGFVHPGSLHQLQWWLSHPHPDGRPQHAQHEQQPIAARGRPGPLGRSRAAVPGGGPP